MERRRRCPRENRPPEPEFRTKVQGLWNDALIALSARQIGATLVTENLQDFGLLRRYVRFEWQAAQGAPD